jgi:hypothetical protein
MIFRPGNLRGNGNKELQNFSKNLDQGMGTPQAWWNLAFWMVLFQGKGQQQCITALTFQPPGIAGCRSPALQRCALQAAWLTLLHMGNSARSHMGVSAARTKQSFVRREREQLCCELMAPHKAGFPHVRSTCGTANKKPPAALATGGLLLDAWQCPTLTWGSPTLPSALSGFTAEFGMGSGGSHSLLLSGKTGIGIPLGLQYRPVDRFNNRHYRKSFWYRTSHDWLCAFNLLACYQHNLIFSGFLPKQETPK